MSSNKGLTVTIIFEAQSLNYDEGYRNLSVLKKIRRASGDVFTYSSRQSLRYSIVKQGHEQFGWNLANVIKKKGAGAGEGVLQAHPDSSISSSEEIDLFGYMKTDVDVGKKKKKEKKKKEEVAKETLTRSAVVRITPAISLEPFFNDIEFLNSKWMADRAKEDPNIANIEQHRSLYKYTITIDLDRIGTEYWNYSLINLESKTKKESWEQIKKKYLTDVKDKEKANRVIELLEVIKILYRDIRGRREDLKPLFIIGGVYPVKNPFFMNVIKINWIKSEPEIIIEPISQILKTTYQYKQNKKLESDTVKNNTFIGLRAGFWKNADDISKLVTHKESSKKNNSASPEDCITYLKNKVKEYYGVNNEGSQG